MALSDEDLSEPIDETRLKFESLLVELQANILKGHGRELTANIFLRFDAKGAARARATLGELARARLTSTKEQLRQTQHYKATGEGDSAIFCLLLTNAGYDALDLASKKPTGDAFGAGMAARRERLADTPETDWDAHLRSVHGMILLGDENGKGLDMAVAQVCGALDDGGIAVAGIEYGRARFNAHGNGIEHFGYVDGRSQPLLLKSDVEKEEKDPNGGIANWNPAFSPLSTVLVRDPGGLSPDSFGSFFVFRKLEQDVRAFKEREQALADELELEGERRELAGALVVGRFEDGTPVIVDREPADTGGVPNDFNYDDDPDGHECPFQAHIRKTNPRGDVKRQFGLPDDSGDRKPIMARRGIPYGVRTDPGLDDIPAMPTGGVGLLFMAYQRSLEDQFEFTQASWANNEDFLRPGTGVDPVIGQGGSIKQQWRADPKAPQTKPFHFAHFVKLKGGDYFFAPSCSFLLSLGGPATAGAPPRPTAA